MIRRFLPLAWLMIMPWVFILARWGPSLLLALSFPLALITAKSVSLMWPAFGQSMSHSYRKKYTEAGRWLEAPVAELDKSTIGKLLASRASRDPGLHVIVRSTPTPTCTDALYDPEIDG